MNNKIITLLFFLIFLNSCQSVKEGLSGKKQKSSDEFLVEKKNPLELPPEYGELPVPKIDEANDKVSEKIDEDIEKLFEKSDFEKSKILFERDIVFNPKSETSYLYLAKIFNKDENDEQ